MTEEIRLTRGHVPWLPAEESYLVATYDSYDGVPLSGVLDTKQGQFVFYCIGGEVEDVSIWVYAAADPEMRSRLEDNDAEGQEFTELLRAELAMVPLHTVAVSVSWIGILDSTTVTEGQDSGAVVQGLLDDVVQRFEAVERGARHQRELLTTV